jgi:hypothetical protein
MATRSVIARPISDVGFCGRVDRWGRAEGWQQQVVEEYLAGTGTIALRKKHRVGQAKIVRILKEAGVHGSTKAFELACDRRRGVPNWTTIARSKPLGRTPTDVEWAYIAGIFDGEGSFYISNNAQSRVQIDQNDCRLLEWITETLGGGGISKPVERRASRWTLSPQRAVFEFLCGVLPYLIVKRAKALEVRDMMADRYGWEVPDGNKVCDCEANLRRRF